MKYEREYALYNNEDLIAIGTMKEIAQEVGFSFDHIKSLRRKKRLSKKYELTKLEEEEE